MHTSPWNMQRWLAGPSQWWFPVCVICSGEKKKSFFELLHGRECFQTGCEHHPATREPFYFLDQGWFFQTLALWTHAPTELRGLCRTDDNNISNNGCQTALRLPAPSDVWQSRRKLNWNHRHPGGCFCWQICVAVDTTVLQTNIFLLLIRSVKAFALLSHSILALKLEFGARSCDTFESTAFHL